MLYRNILFVLEINNINDFIKRKSSHVIIKFYASQSGTFETSICLSVLHGHSLAQIYTYVARKACID